MNSKKWVDLTDNEKNNLSLNDAYKVGASEMFDYLTELMDGLMDELSEADYKSLKEEVKPHMDDKE